MTRQPDLLDDSEEVTHEFNHKKHEATLRKLVAQERLGVQFKGTKYRVTSIIDCGVLSGDVLTQVAAGNLRINVWQHSAAKRMQCNRVWHPWVDATFALIHDPSQYPKAASH